MSNDAGSGIFSGGGGWVEVLGWRGFVWVVIPVIWALAYLPQMNARDLRHEEGRRATPAAEMLRSGDWVTPRIYGEPYLNKPPLYFWIVAGIGKVLGGVTALATRIPSAISVLLGAWLLAGFGARELSRHTRVLAALLFLSMPVTLDKGTLGELDAFLSMLTFASFAALWAAYDARRGRIALWGWVLSGVAMGLAVLAKGPGGPIEFYAIFIAFALLAGRGRWKLLVSPGHFVMMTVAAAPVVCWMAMMLVDARLGAGTVGSQWADQLGLGAFFPLPSAASQFAQAREGNPPVLPHYLWFPLDVLKMMLPWSLLAIGPSLPALARRVGWSGGGAGEAGADGLSAVPRAAFRAGPGMRDLWVLLAVSAPALIVPFWLWPVAKPRHMLMITYPVAVLVALGLATREAWPRRRELLELLAGVARIVAIAIVVIAIGGVVAAGIRWRLALPVTCMVAAGAVIVGILAFRWTARTPVESAPVALAANLALVVLMGWAVVTSVAFPYTGARESTRVLHEQIDRLVPRQYPVYTTRTLLSSKGDDYYNAQFYLPGGARALPEISELPQLVPGQTVTVILGPDEWEALRRVDPEAVKLGILDAPKGPPPLWVAEVRVPGKSKSGKE